MTLTAGARSGLASIELRCACWTGCELVRVVLEVGPLKGIIIVFATEGHISVVAAAMLYYTFRQYRGYTSFEWSSAVNVQVAPPC